MACSWDWDVRDMKNNIVLSTRKNVESEGLCLKVHFLMFLVKHLFTVSTCTKKHSSFCFRVIFKYCKLHYFIHCRVL